MEKKLYELIIDEEFRDLISPLDENERQILEDSIVTNGCEMPLVVWKGIIVDGHNRYEICKKNGIIFAVEEKEFEGRDDAKLWIIENQLGRRNLNDYQKIEISIRYEEIIRKDSKERQKRKKRGFVQSEMTEQNKGKTTREIISKIIGVSNGNYYMGKKLAEDADEETKRQLRQGDKNIGRAYRELKEKEKSNNSTENEIGQKDREADRTHTRESEPKPGEEMETPIQRFDASHHPLSRKVELEIKPIEGTRDLSPYDIDRTEEEIISLGGVPADDEQKRGISEFMMVKADVKRHLDYSVMKLTDLFTGLTALSSTDENLDALEGMIDEYCMELKEQLENHRRKEQ